MTHTPTPWSVDQIDTMEAHILGAPSNFCADVIGTINVLPEIDDARRIVECVNACAGLNPAAIPDVVDALKSARDILAHSGAENGTCMCGELRGSHNENSGHSFVDSHAYHAAEQVASIDKALSKLQVQS